MNWIQRIVAFLWLLASVTVQAQTDHTTAEQLLRQSGLWDQLALLSRSYADNAVTEVAKTSPMTSDAEKARLHRMVKQAFAADRLQSTALKTVALEMQPGHTARVLDWYDSAAGRALRQAEVRSVEDQSRLQPEDLMQAGKALRRQLPAERRKLLDELVSASQAAESMLQITEGSLLALQRGLSLAHPEQPALSDQQMRRELRSHRQAMLDAFTEWAKFSTALTYHGVSDRDLKDYELAIAAVRRSEQRGRLAELDEKIEAVIARSRWRQTLSLWN